MDPNVERRSMRFEKFSLMMGAMAAAGLIVWFLLMALLGLEHVIALRFVNYLIIGGVMFYALGKWKATSASDLTYFQGLGIGFITGLSSGLFFSFFMFFYMRISTDFFMAVQPDLPFTVMGTPGIVSVFIFLETFIISAILSFILMQYFKSSRHF